MITLFSFPDVIEFSSVVAGLIGAEDLLLLKICQVWGSISFFGRLTAMLSPFQKEYRCLE